MLLLEFISSIINLRSVRSQLSHSSLFTSEGLTLLQMHKSNGARVVREIRSLRRLVS